MLRHLSRISTVRGVIDRRILANYRLDAEAAAAQLPKPFYPKLVHGFAIGGICMIRLKKVRPGFVPVPAGIRSENAAHRIAVQWEEGGQVREGVYIPRRDTDSRLNAIAGGRLFPGAHHHADFVVKETPDQYDVSFTSRDGTCSMQIQAALSYNFPQTSVFDSLGTASHFFEKGSLGYSATRNEGRFDGLELDCDEWEVEPLEVVSIRSSFFDDLARFPEGSVRFDSAILMRDIDHTWRQRGVMCCDTLA